MNRRDADSSIDHHTAACAYVDVADPEFVVFLDFEGRWSQADPFTFKTPEEAEARIVELHRHTFAPPTFTYHVVRRTTTDEAVT